MMTHVLLSMDASGRVPRNRRKNLGPTIQPSTNMASVMVNTQNNTCIEPVRF
jgi:hypothetical protein